MKNCSSKEHGEIKANCYCNECKVYMCSKCEIFHSNLFSNHHSYSLDINIKDIFTGICKEENHSSLLEYFCKTHNQLCCDSCIIKFKRNGKGKHSECKVCYIEDIKEEKKNNLNENIKQLEDLLNNLEESINNIKGILERINKNKEELKTKVQKIFTKIRNAINDREDEILFDIDKKFEESYFKEDIIKKSEKLPKKAKNSLEIMKKINQEWNDEKKLNSLINDCINIENNIKEINYIKEAIKNFNKSNNLKINYFQDEEEINKILNKIKILGKYTMNSKIINNDEEKEKLKDLLELNDEKEFKLLFRLSENGNDKSKFHELCDNKGPTISLFCLEDGNKVGIYTPLSWDTNSGWKSDEKTFIFSLNKNKKYKKIDGYSIYCHQNYGPFSPNFGSSKNMNKFYYDPKYIKSYYENSSDILPNNGKSNDFIIVETEIFEIL